MGSETAGALFHLAAQLEKLGITAAGAVLTDADDKFLRAYYGKKKRKSVRKEKIMDMKMQFLVSAVKEDVETLAERMNLQADAIIVNQCDENAYREYTYQGHTMKCYSFAERGVGLSRNNCLMRADGDLCVFADEDICLPAGSGAGDCAGI